MSRQSKNERHESLCRRCGQCCREKVNVNGVVFSTTRSCRHYDPASGLCRVYERRFDVNRHCLSVEEGIRFGVFPADCPYVAGIDGYTPPCPEILGRGVLRLLDSGRIVGIDDLIETARRNPPGPDELSPQCDTPGKQPLSSPARVPLGRRESHAPRDQPHGGQ